ncbi:hypothetical protein [Marinobacter sp.]|uniref:TRAFAC clade GTPase domain-containing protein n=1 Tax=Marinobacter sp. TaxID=50741 RepID=UPI0034A3E87F
MTFECSHGSCFPDTTCALGHTNRAECEHWSGESPSATQEQRSSRSEPPESTSDIPWNGYALGTGDLAILGGRGRPAVVGLIGPPDSGKTSLLAYLYMWLLEHGTIANWTFAGSWTLGGWESVVHYSRWTSEPSPSFPPHTSSSGRHPGILHLALRSQATGRLRDVLLTDAPGEWFSQWSRTPDSSASEGARWVIERADALLLLVDTGALSDGKKLPASRRATRDLMEQVGAKTSCRTAVVWTKDDVSTAGTVTKAIETASGEFMPAAQTMRTTVKDPATIEACFEWAVEAAIAKSPMQIEPEPRLSQEPFLALRRSYEKR